MADARALKDGARAVNQVGYNKIEIEGDNLIVIQALKGNFQIPWQINFKCYRGCLCLVETRYMLCHQSYL